MENINNAIEVRCMYKDFKRVYDKPTTLKERLVFWQREKPEMYQVLKNINIDIKKGETVALVGTNGSGKSTLLKLMTKILYPNKGTLITNGKLTSLLELGAGFHPDFTGRENIYFNAAIFGLTKIDIDKRIEDIIEFSELGTFIDNPVRTYSSGMYMRLAFSVAINVDADILLIDEILAVGDQHFQDKCFAKLMELRDSEKTIVIVSHSLDTVEKLCTRAIWIYDGEVRMDGDPSVVINHYLEQVIIDHEKNAGNDEPDIIKCNLCVDSPDENEKVKKKQYWVVHGWEASNIRNTEIKVYIDNSKPLLASRVKRDDVIMLIQDDYGGSVYNKNAGWHVVIDTRDMEDGKHIIKVEVCYKNKVVKEKICNIIID